MGRKLFPIIIWGILLSISCYPKKENFHRNILAGDAYLFSNQIADSVRSQNISNQLGAIWSSAIGDHQNALKLWDANRTENISDLKLQSTFALDLPNIKGEDLKIALVAEASKYNWLILNEQHHNSLHRISVENILEALKAEGYTNLGLEHLSGQDTLLSERGYPISSSVDYYFDPQLFNLIRAALDLDYHVFSYDGNCNNSGYEREQCQAKNILTNVKEGKTIILCGYDHAVEGRHRSWDKAMAGMLKERLKEEVLSVNQTYLTEHSALYYANSYYRSFSFDGTVVLNDPDSVLTSMFKANFYEFDEYIYHPVTKYIEDRPAWLLRKGYEKVQIELPKQITKPCLVFAFDSNETHEKAVPVDVVEVKDKTSKTANLIVPENKEIIYLAKDQSGQIIEID